ncbi:major facilitator superfamily domain-containing protein [Leucosporidium creatinivorum]|uniref:Major facilitator superfamily domain-containing protein n=1 Tax=Leucosporidium creatinivorum TaxID=106004 RepID=A0A1Y2DX51_9BASI|nr:major facilitator superfamily domain-containing protein [Leucosporidium creatinivorum]
MASSPPSASHTLTDDSPVEREKEGAIEVPYGPPTTPSAPPEGGLRAWMNVVGAFLILFCGFGFSNSFGVLENYYATHQFSSESPSNIAWVGSIQLWCLFSLGIVSGPLYDRGYFRPLLSGGSAFYMFTFFMTSLCKEFWQTILAQGFGMGIGMGLMFIPAISVLSQYFQRRRSLAMGIAVVGSSVGGVCFPIALNNLLAEMEFGPAYRIVGYLNLGLLVVANVIMSPRLKPVAGAPRPPHVSPLTFFKEKRYVLVITGAFFIALGLFTPFFFLQSFCEYHGLSQTISFYSLSILNAASIFGRTIPNAMADYYGPMNMLIPMCVGSTVLVWAMFGATNSGGAINFAILYGFFSGGYVSLVNPVFASMANAPTEIGARIGVAFVLVGLAALVGTPIAGALLVRTPSFVAPICFSAGVMVIGCALFVLARMEQARIKGTWKV